MTSQRPKQKVPQVTLTVGKAVAEDVVGKDGSIWPICKVHMAHSLGTSTASMPDNLVLN